MMRSFIVFIALVFCVSSAVAFDLKSAKKGLDKVKSLDLDGDNQINLHEFKKAGGKEKYFKKVDSDNDGFISIKDAKKQLKRLY